MSVLPAPYIQGQIYSAEQRPRAFSDRKQEEKQVADLGPDRSLFCTVDLAPGETGAVFVGARRSGHVKLLK